jgi:hypothetical protein
MTATYAYHPASKPIPAGWVMVGKCPGHHGVYSVLIKKVDIATEN